MYFPARVPASSTRLISDCAASSSWSRPVNPGLRAGMVNARRALARLLSGCDVYFLLYRLAARLVARPGEVGGTGCRPSVFQTGYIPSCYMTYERLWVLPTADACRWLLLLPSPLRRTGGRPPGEYEQAWRDGTLGQVPLAGRAAGPAGHRRRRRWPPLITQAGSARTRRGSAPDPGPPQRWLRGRQREHRVRGIPSPAA